MRHSLAQLLAASSSQGSPGAPAAACWRPSPAAEQEETAAARRAEESPESPDGSELLFPAGLELDAWLEAAVAGGDEDEASPPARRPGGNRVKAAAAARLNRQKKKLYVQGLEARLQGLAAENRQLRDRNRGLGRRLRDLERETGYLRAVLANQSALGRLLGRLAGDGAAAGGLGLRMRIGSSLFQDPGGGGGEHGDHDYALPIRAEEAAEKRRPAPSGGVCLHVDRDRLSVEFCALCAKRAAGAEASAASLPPPPAPSFLARM